MLLCVTEKLESLSNSIDNIKTAYDQKACKLLNKTTAIYDKLKEQSDDIKVISDKCKNNHGPSPNKTQHKKPNEKQPKTKLTTAKPLNHKHKMSQNKNVFRNQNPP